MYQTTKSHDKSTPFFMLFALCLAMILPLNSNAASTGNTIETAPYFNEKARHTGFFDNSLALTSANEFKAALDKKWDYATDLNHKVQGDKQVASCLELQAAIDGGFTEAKAYEYQYVRIQSRHCMMWQQLANLKPYSTSYLDTVTLNKDFVRLAPAKFALAISNEFVEIMQKSATWEEFSKTNEFTEIKEVTTVSATESIYYDNSGGAQRLTLMGKGDHNGDGIEDWILYMETNLEGGSYFITEVFVVTRLSENAPITLLTTTKN